MLDSYVICVLVLYIWKLLFPTKLLEYQSCDWYLYNFATRMSICRLPAFSVYSLLEREKELAAHVDRNGGKGTRTPDIQLAKLALYQLSYAPRILERKDRDSCRRLRLRGVDLRTLCSLTP